ncbi:phage tail tape measure protein [Lacticaseibacillus parakribbianus]|uniref:phage tail tape measure protein n=1 Tax=Lacticaseibacillus parakribbianus TaxID=2970927 RepID=UPI0021CAF973|nr:phage tail tape measure protein [Lacticaseibacillus parakribbianus]
MADGTVKIDVKLITSTATAAATALKSTLKDVDVKPEAATNAKKLATALDETKDAAKGAAEATKADATAKKQESDAADKATDSTKKKTDSTKKDTDETKRNSDETTKAVDAQKQMASSLEAQGKYWDSLSKAQEQAGLKTSAAVSHLNGLKSELGQTTIETNEARNKLVQLSVAEGENSAKTNEARNAYVELAGKQAALGLETQRLESKIGGLTPQMAAAADKVRALGDRFTSAGEKLSAVGSKMTIGITAPIVAGLAYAGKAAVTFDSEIQSMGSLLDDGTVSAAGLKAELTGLGNASKKWSTQYGVSTSNINNGMSELIKKGYSYNQVLGAMPSILDAARASGDDFGEVMSVATSTLEQFGLKSNNTAQMLKNTQRVTDSLTYVANATSSGFQDLGLAMQYVGPVASGMGMSLEQTAAILGNLSQEGIEGEKAGTGLRSVLSSLTVQSGQAGPAMKKLGVNVAAFKSGAIGLPEVIDEIAETTKGWKDAQKAAVLQQAFGIDGQSAMNILINEGSASLRKLTKDTQNSTGYTKKLAETMNNTSQANVDKFKASLNTLAITVGAKLLPQITDLVKKGTDLVNWFSELDEGTQDMILKSIAAAAVMGPVISGVGKLSTGLGVLSRMGGGAIEFLGRFTGGAAKTGKQTGLLAGLFGKLTGAAPAAGAGIAEAATAAEGAGAAMTGAGVGTTGFVASLAPLAPALLVAGAAVAGGIAWWELYGKKAAESADRTKRWGADIGPVADKAATQLQQASGKIAGAFDDTNHTVKENAATIVKGFDDMTKAAKAAADESDKVAKKLAKSLGGEAGSNLEAAAAKEKAANAKRIAQIQSDQKKVDVITAAAKKSGVALTAEQIQVLDNLRADSAASAVKTLKLSGKEENNVLKAILGEKVTMSRQAADNQLQDMTNSYHKEVLANEKAQDQIKDKLKNNATERNAALEGLEKDHQAKMNGIYRGTIQAMKVRGDTEDEIVKNMSYAFKMSASDVKKALKSYDDSMAKSTKSTKNFAASVGDGMSEATKKAGNEWNKLVLDPKTGKVVTNLPEVLKQTASTQQGWSQLEFELKNAHITSNAKQAIVEAMAATDQWKKLPTWEKTAIIRTQGREQLANVMEDFVDWDSLDPKEQQAVVKGDYAPLIDALTKSGDWDKLTLKEKTALVKDKASLPLINMLEASGDWQKMTFKEKMAIVNAKGAGDLATLAQKYDGFVTLPDAVKKAALKDPGFLESVANDSIKYGKFKDLPDAIKKAILNDEDLQQKLIDAGVIIDKYNLLKPNKKKATADTNSVQNNFGLGTAAVNKYKNTSPGPTKHAKGKNDASKEVDAATKSAQKWAGQGMGPTKVAKGSNPASSPIDQATKSAKAWQGQGMGSTKTAKALDHASGPAKTARDAVSKFASGKSTFTKTLSVVANFGKGVAKVLGFRTGTSNFHGGGAIINDETGPVYQELLTLPNGTMAVAKGRNVFLPGLPAGTAITPARKTAQLMQSGVIPRFAGGTSGGTNDVLDRLTGFTPEMASGFTPETSSVQMSLDSGSSVAIKGLSKSIGQLEQAVATMLQQRAATPDVLEIHTHAHLDKREMTDEMAAPLRVKMQQIDDIKNQRRGIRNDRLSN